MSLGVTDAWNDQPGYNDIYLMDRGKRCHCSQAYHWPAKGELELTRFVEDVILEADPEEMGALVAETDPLDRRALALATKYVHEWRVVVWARMANVEKGVAPSTRSELEYAEVQRLEIADGLRHPTWGTAAEAKGRRWARRLRLRWGGRHGALPDGERLEPAEMLPKVSNSRHGHPVYCQSGP